MTDMVQHATDDSFDATVASGVALVDFWADWCGPCKALAPTLDEIAGEYAGEVAVVKVDIVANEATAARFAARSIPLLVLMKDGEEKARMTGAVSKTRLAAFIDANL